MSGAAWAGDYIGLPWEPPHRDCWSFFREIQRVHFGVEVPIVDVDTHDLRAVVAAIDADPERARWVETDTPQAGDGVLMARSAHPVHVGIWIEVAGGRVLHCAPGAGVLCQSVESLRFSGWGGVRFYRRSENSEA